MNGKSESAVERRSRGWIWVWAALVAYLVLEIARLS